MPYRLLTAVPRRRTQPAEGAFPEAEAGGTQHDEKSLGQRPGAGESACRPGSVPPLARGDGHPSRTAVAGSLVRSTREHRAGRPQSLAQGARGSPLDLAPGGVYRAAAVTCGAGGLLHHRFTLTPALTRGRSVFCGTVPRVAPGRRYRPPCPVEPGPSSPGLRPARPPGRLTRAQDTPNAAGPEWLTHAAPANDASDSIAAATEPSGGAPALANSGDGIQCALNALIGNGSRSARRGRRGYQPRCRVNNRSVLSSSNSGISACLPGLACSVFSAEAKVSNSAK